MPPINRGQIDDLSLFAEIAAGDETPFATLFQRYGPRLHSYFSRLIKSESQAEELVQDTFIRVWVARAKLTEIRQHRSWIYRVAANEAYTWVRRRAAEARSLEQLMIPATAGPGEKSF